AGGDRRHRPLILACRTSPCFFQAEDGIRDFHVTGVQTCALPISLGDFTEKLHEQLQVGMPVSVEGPYGCFTFDGDHPVQIWIGEIGRASCRERVYMPLRAGTATDTCAAVLGHRRRTATRHRSGAE